MDVVYAGINNVVSIIDGTIGNGVKINGGSG